MKTDGSIKTLDFFPFIAIGLAFCLIYADSTVLSIALPVIQNSFHTTTTAIFWVVNSYMLTRAIMVLAAGRISDMYSHAWVFIFGVILLILTSLGGAFAQSEISLIFFRSLQGIGATFIFVAGMSLITAYAPPEKKARYIGHVMSAALIGMALGPVVGGVIIKYLSWPWIFFMNVLLGSVALILSIPLMQKNSIPKNDNPLFDWPGFLLSALFTLCFSMACEYDYRFFLIGLVSLAAFIAVEKRSSAPLVDLKVFMSVSFLINSMIGSISQIGVMFVVFLAVFFQKVLGYSPMVASLLLLPMVGVGACSSTLGGWMADKWGARVTLMFGMGCVSLGFLLTLCMFEPISYYRLLPLLIFSGIGLFMINGPIRATLLNDAPTQQHGMINATFTSIRSIISVIGFSITATLYTHGFFWALLFVGALCWISFLLTFIRIAK